MTTSFARHLQTELQVLHRIARSKWPKATANRDLYTEYLTQTYHYVVASVPLMIQAKRVAARRGIGEYVVYLDHHIEEERHHAAWLREDLRALTPHGLTPPSSETMSLAGIGYYAVRHCGPLSLLGYMYALESSPLSAEALRDLQVRCNLSGHHIRTLEIHSDNDPHHREELEAILSSDMLSSDEQARVSSVATATLRAGIQLLDSLVPERPHCALGRSR